MLHIRKIFVRNDVNLEPNCNECYQHGVLICHELPQIDLVCITIIPQTNILMVTCPCELCDMCSRVALTHRIFPPSGAEGTTMCLPICCNLSYVALHSSSCRGPSFAHSKNEREVMQAAVPCPSGTIIFATPHFKQMEFEISRSTLELQTFRALRVNICSITRLRLISRLHFLRHLRPCVDVDVTAVQWEP